MRDLDASIGDRLTRERVELAEQRAADRLLADAAALERLAAYPEWHVLDRLLMEHAASVARALRTRGVGPVETEALRAELDAIEWLKERPAALRKILEDRDAVRAQQEPQRRTHGT